MPILLWVLFLGLIILALAVDLFWFHRTDQDISIAEAFWWTGIWIFVALLFNGAIYLIYEHHWLGIDLVGYGAHPGRQAALDFLTGLILEKSLSLDNLFVIALIFSSLHISAAYQHRILFWGILGAIVMRGVMILGGTMLISRISWLTYIFGLLLFGTALRMLFAKAENIDPNRNLLVRWVRKFYPVSEQLHDGRFFVTVNGRRAVTRAFLALLIVETSDVMFAVDSVPAIFAVTLDPFIIFSSNIFAILGLRSLYFALSGAMQRFHYIKYGLVGILLFIGLKLLLVHLVHIPTVLSLGIIILLLTLSTAASLFSPPAEGATPFADQIEQFGRITLKQGRRLVVLVVGLTILFIGVVMIIAPGPAFIVIPIGLGILATEFVWAKRLLQRLKCTANDVGKFIKRKPRNHPKPARSD